MATLYTVPMPKELFPRGLLAPSLIAHILVQKYRWGLPFHRLAKMLATQGAPIDDGTMCRYAEHAGATRRRKPGRQCEHDDRARPDRHALRVLNVYWANEGGEVFAAPLSGGALTTQAVDEATHGIAVDATGVYWTSFEVAYDDGGSVTKAPLGGGAPSTLAAGLHRPWAVAVDATSVYWVDNESGAVMKRTPK